jgi:RNA polymerase sigma-70 factor, ECF subfamily
VQQADAEDRDADLLAMLRRREHEAAFGLLADRYEQKIFRLCSAMLRHSQEAEDAAQESLLRVWKSLASYDGRASLSTWTYTIARNRCLTAIERRRHADSLSDEAVVMELDATHHSAPEPPDDRAALLQALVEELPERYRQTMKLYYYQDRAVEDVAAMLGSPSGTVKTNLHRGRQLLAARLQQLGLGQAAYWLEETA